jgi:hypothetical protein
MLMLAAAEGVGLPSATLEALGTVGDRSWQTLNGFQARVSVHMDDGEHGEPIIRAPLDARGHIESFDDELDLLED